MATTTTVHAQLIRYATNGDQVIVNLKSAGSDISIDRTNTKLPTSVTTAQTLANALGNLAFKDSLGKSDVGLGSVDNTADANKSVKYATSAGSAGSATKDSANQQINTTYIKGLSASGRTITITKGDGTTSTLTTQDTNTTYGVFAKATADAAGGTGLVPAPAKGQQGLYLRGDGSWATPTNTTYGVFKAATASAAGGTGLVPQPAAGAQGKFLRGDGTWQTPTDTNTWRGIQDNLTSTSTTDSLSANQGRALKNLVDGKAASSHTHTISQITDSIPASKITGTLSLSNIPAGALERLVPVTDDTARLKLTASQVQNGDVVKVNSTGKMYFVKDDTKLTSEDGYEVFAAGTAAAVAWANVTGKPSSMPASDVSSWAKASTKPTYTKSEVGLSNVDNTADANKSVKYATSAGSANAVAWANVSGKPAIVGKQTRTLTAAGPSGWKDATTDQGYIPDMSFIAYWNGAYSGSSSNLAYCNKGAFGSIVTKNSGDYAAAGHTHSYAGSGSAGGSANSAVKLDTATAGSTTQPVYFTGGKPVAIGYTIAKSVPSDAVFTDHTYGNMKGASSSAAGSAGLVPAPATGQQGLYLRGDGTWATPTNTTYGVFKAATASAAGGTGLVPQPAAGAQNKFLRADGTWQTPTDTNTWRGVQNNLTSTATDQSLSAAQGKALNESKMGAVSANGYYGMAKPDGTSTDWIRTTSSGLIPNQSGSRGSGHAALGTSSWYFANSYVDNTYCNKSTIADKVRMEYDTTNNCLNFVFL